MPRQQRKLVRVFKRKGSPFWQYQVAATPDVVDHLKHLDKIPDHLKLDARGAITWASKHTEKRKALAFAHELEPFVAESFDTAFAIAWINSRLKRAGKTRITVLEYFEMVEKEERDKVAKGKLNKRTLTRLIQQRGYFTTWLQAEHPGKKLLISDITLDHLKVFMDWLENRAHQRGHDLTKIGYDAETRKSTRSHLSGLWEKGMVFGYTSANPWKHHDVKVSVPKKDWPIVPDNYVELLESQKPDWETDAMLALLYLVARQSDLCALQRTDVLKWCKFDRAGAVSEFGELRMPQPKVRRKNQAPKIVPLIPLAEVVLRRQIARHESLFVFPRLQKTTGILEQMSNQYMVKRLNRRMDKIFGTSLFSPHSMRRTGVTVLLEAGVPVDMVQRMAGQLDEEMVWRYAQQNRERRQQAGQKFSTALDAKAAAASAKKDTAQAKLAI